jgi:hypothetical protein
MHRRSFLASLGLTLGSLSCMNEVARWIFPDGGHYIRFFVAGVRFHSPVHGLKAGEKVIIKPSLFRGRRCYEVLASNGQRIGFLPRYLIPFLNTQRTWRSEISIVDANAVPWKKYQILISA